MYSKLQFERPMSRAEAIPAGAICKTQGFHDKIGLLNLVQLSQNIRTHAAKKNLVKRWQVTTESG